MKRLAIQRVVGHFFLIPLGLSMIFLLRLRGGYQIKAHQEIRKRYNELVTGREPVIICPNHLTLIDSVILLWAFGSLPWYFLNYHNFAWNVPAAENAKSKLSWRFITFVSKCILIDRSGGPDHRNRILDEMCECLTRGDRVMLFPEGTRSRSGSIEVENVTYGVGRIIQRVPKSKVLCVYLRGENQERYSSFPAKGERFDVDLEVIQPTSSNTGLREVRDYSIQVIEKLQEMENRYRIERNTRAEEGTKSKCGITH
jgi:hypothetical protein